MYGIYTLPASTRLYYTSFLYDRIALPAAWHAIRLSPRPGITTTLGRPPGCLSPRAPGPPPEEKVLGVGFWGLTTLPEAMGQEP